LFFVSFFPTPMLACLLAAARKDSFLTCYQFTRLTWHRPVQPSVRGAAFQCPKSKMSKKIVHRGWRSIWGRYLTIWVFT
jgi:hypothetical protein